MVPVVYPKERKVLDFIVQYINRNGYSPTLQEIADGIGVKSPATIHEHIWYLMRKGYLKKTTGVMRSLEVVNERIKEELQAQIELPLMGFIAAGKPLEPYSDPNATFSVASTMVSGKKPAYVLKVKGDSMIEDGILDGDYVIIEHQDNANNGDIVVAMLESGFVTLKRFFKEDGQVKLAPANSQMAPIYATNVTIQGRCVGLVRKFD